MLDAQRLLDDLEPTVERLLERHLATIQGVVSRTSTCRTAEAATPIAGEQWSEDDADLAGATIDEAVRSALLVNLLTEDNLPYYFRTIEQVFGRESAWGTWVRRWTAEEGRHSMAIYSYLMVTRAIDPHHLERCRMAQVSGGVIPEPATLHDGFVYLSLQELATRISHRATGKMIGDPAGYEVMMRVAGDENLHQLFYRDLTAAAIGRRPRRDDVRDRASGHVVHDARHRHPGIRRARQSHRPGRHLRPRRAPRADPRAGRAPHVGRRARHRSRPPTASRRASG